MPTTRDQIWHTVLDLMQYQRGITAADVRNAIENGSPSKRTILDTLNTMVDFGYLESSGGTGSAPQEYHPIQPSPSIRTDGYTPSSSNHSGIFPYPGSKGRLAEWIIEYMPEHDTYVEVFGGSAGVLYNKPRSKYEIYNDIDDNLTHFFKILRDQPDELAEWLSSVPYSRSQYEEWVEDYYNSKRPDDPIARAGQFFSIRYMQFAGVSSGENGFKARARRSPARTFDNARDRLDAFAERFDQIIIETLDYDQLFGTYDDSAADVLFFADPPYPEKETHYRTNFDHDRFIDALGKLQNDWIVTYSNPPERLTDMAQTIVHRDTRRRMQRKAATGTDTLLSNFYTENRTDFINS